MESRKKYIVILLTVTCFMVIGFAVLSTSITLSGTTTVNANTWNVKFQNIVEDSNNNVTATTAPTISDNTSVSFAVTLDKPGDKYSFTVDVVNTGSIDAMINTVSKSSLTTEQAKYLDYTVVYNDGSTINQKDKLVKTNGSETIKVTIDYKKDITVEDLPTSVSNINLTFGLDYVQGDNTAKETLSGFIARAKAGNATSSDIGKTYTVNLGSTYGDHTIRVANVSTPAACSNSGFSGTACGVVFEFADIITFYNMNDWDTVMYANLGGWKSSTMRKFVNNDLYNALSYDLRNSIINTTVVSSHGSKPGDTNNFTTTDKLYLLSAHEVWSDVTNDTAYDSTRQLDYYEGLSITTSSYSDAIKMNNGSAHGWWLRSAALTDSFFVVKNNGKNSLDNGYFEYGVSPAFRIA